LGSGAARLMSRFHDRAPLRSQRKQNHNARVRAEAYHRDQLFPFEAVSAAASIARGPSLAARWNLQSDRFGRLAPAAWLRVPGSGQLLAGLWRYRTNRTLPALVYAAKRPCRTEGTSRTRPPQAAVRLFPCGQL